MEIQHDTAANRFIMRLDEDEQAELAYRELGGATVDFYRTFVPEPFRGRGLAAQLVKAGFTWARDAGLTIQTSCWYAGKKLQQQEQAAG